MRTRLLIVIAGLCLTSVVLAGCSPQKSIPNAVGKQATVVLNDGSNFAGTVTALSPDSISIKGPNGETRTYPMGQVGSLQYGPAPANAAGQGTSAVLTPAPPQATAPLPPLPNAATLPNTAAAPAPNPAQEYRTIPSGATIAVRNNSTIDSQTAQPGQTFSGVIERDVRDTDGGVAIPRGASALLVVRSVSGQGRIQGQSDLLIDVASVKVGGHDYRLETSGFAVKGQAGVGKNQRTGAFAGGGAALGGIIGAIAGGGKGAAIGLLSGAGAGVAAQTATRGKAVRIPSETLLEFRLEAPVRVHALN